MADEISRWDPAAVVARAKALIHASNYEKVSEARKDVDDALTRWVATVQTQSDPKCRARGSTAVVALWRQYAALEMELRQFKQATKVFERAVGCPVSGTSTALWLQYAEFCVQRKKFSNARKVFVRAIKALPEREQTTVWQRFHAFVQSHVDPKLTLPMLQHQVLPEKFPSATPAPTPTPASAPPPVSAPTSTPAPNSVPVSTSTPAPVTSSVVQPSQAQQTDVGANGVPKVALVDPVVAFIDRKGEVDLTQRTAARTPSPLAVESVGRATSGALKRGATVDGPSGEAVKRPKQDVTVPGKTSQATEATAFFVHVPQTLPFIPSCPHLLFDSVGDGEEQQQIGNELLERLSDVLGDSAVFEGVRDLRDNQRKRDREVLYRWQELVGVQMKEGSELFARHVALEMQHGFSDPRGLIALKTQHLEQRREFSRRCQMSQEQFISVCAVERVNALKAQQISLLNMQIPEMRVTTEAEPIGMQRAIVGLILEAEKLWREENPPPAPVAMSDSVLTPSKKVHSTPAASVAAPPRSSARPRRDSQDSTTSSHSTTRSSSTGAGGGAAYRQGAPGRQDPRTATRNWNASGGAPRRRDRERERERERDSRSFGSRGRSKWDMQPAQQQPVPSPAAAAALSHSRFERAGPTAARPQDPPPQQLPVYDPRMQPPQQAARHFQQPTAAAAPPQQYGAVAASYEDFGGRQGPPSDRRGGYGPPSGAYYPGPHEDPRLHADGNRFVGQEGPSRAGMGSGTGPGGAMGWQQQQKSQEQAFHQRPRTGPPQAGEDFGRPQNPALSRYGSGVGADPGAPPYGAPNARRRGEMPPDAAYYQEPPQDQYAPYAYDDFGPPPGAFPPQQQHGRPMGAARGSGIYGPGPQQQQPQRRQQQPRFAQDHLLPSPAMNKGFGGRNRRGGRYGRR